MKAAVLLYSVLLSFAAGQAAAGTPAQDLAPGGTLRVAVAVGPTHSAFRAVRDPLTGAPKGVAIDLAKALAEKLGVPLQLVPFATPGAITDAVAAGAWDVAFLPADVERAKRLDFSTPYYLYDSTFLVRRGSAIRDEAGIDRTGVRVAVIANTTTMHNLTRSLKKAVTVPFRTEQEALAAIGAGKVDVVAMGREPLERMAQKLPGSRLLENESRASGVAAAVPKDRGEGLAYLTRFIEEAKTSGTVQQALEAAGVTSGIVAPPVAVN